MTRAYFIAAVVVMLAACQPKENREQLKAINESLEKSNELIKDACRRTLMEMEEKRYKLPGDESINRWLSIMNKVKIQSDSISRVIEDLQDEIIKQSDGLKEEDAVIFSTLQQPQGLGYYLLKELASYKDRIHTILSDSVSNLFNNEGFKVDIRQLRKASPLLPDYAENMNEKQRTGYFNKWLDNNLRGSSALMIMVVINKLMNDLLLTRAMLMDYCNSKVGLNEGCYFDKISAIAVLSSSYVKAGQTIEVTAGAAEFSTKRKPGVSIFGKEIKLDEQGVALYKFKAIGSPGKHILPVKISFLWKNGSPGSLTKNLEYTIADEK